MPFRRSPITTAGRVVAQVPIVPRITVMPTIDSPAIATSVATSISLRPAPASDRPFQAAAPGTRPVPAWQARTSLGLPRSTLRAIQGQARVPSARTSWDKLSLKTEPMAFPVTGTAFANLCSSLETAIRLAHQQPQHLSQPLRPGRRPLRQQRPGCQARTVVLSEVVEVPRRLRDRG